MHFFLSPTTRLVSQKSTFTFLTPTKLFYLQSRELNAKWDQQQRQQQPSVENSASDRKSVHSPDNSHPVPKIARTLISHIMGKRGREGGRGKDNLLKTKGGHSGEGGRRGPKKIWGRIEYSVTKKPQRCFLVPKWTAHYWFAPLLSCSNHNYSFLAHNQGGGVRGERGQLREREREEHSIFCSPISKPTKKNISNINLVKRLSDKKKKSK